MDADRRRPAAAASSAASSARTPTAQGLLYVGTELGIHVSFDDGANWQPLQGNLPVTPIYDFVVKDTDLVVATHGRSFWILDDLTPLHQMRDELLTAEPTTC